MEQNKMLNNYSATRFIGPDENGKEYKVSLELGMSKNQFAWNIFCQERQSPDRNWEITSENFPDSILSALGWMKDNIIRDIDKSFSTHLYDFNTHILKADKKREETTTII